MPPRKNTSTPRSAPEPVKPQRYEILSTIGTDKDGKRCKQGDVVELTSEQAERRLRHGSARKVD